jgi:hypothetical protein
MAEYNFSVSDGVRKVSAPTAAAAARALAVCQANNLTTNAQLDTFLQGLSTVAALRTAVIMLVEGLIDVGPP